MPDDFDHHSETVSADGLEAGDEIAANELYERFAVPVCRLAESLLDERLRRKLDGEDIAQSVFRTFFRRVEDGQYQFDHSGALWRLLKTVTKNKVYYWVRYYKAQLRNIDREAGTPLDKIEIASLQPYSEEDLARQLANAVETTVGELSERDEEIFRLSCGEGLPTVEIASQIGCSVATVNRVLARIREQIRVQLDWD